MGNLIHKMATCMLFLEVGAQNFAVFKDDHLGTAMALLDGRPLHDESFLPSYSLCLFLFSLSIPFVLENLYEDSIFFFIPTL